MSRDDLAAFVQRVTRQAVPDYATEDDLFGYLEFRYRWMEHAWQVSLRRLVALGYPIISVDADEVSRSTTALTEGHSTTTV